MAYVRKVPTNAFMGGEYRVLNVNTVVMVGVCTRYSVRAKSIRKKKQFFMLKLEAKGDLGNDLVCAILLTVNILTNYVQTHGILVTWMKLLPVVSFIKIFKVFGYSGSNISNL